MGYGRAREKIMTKTCQHCATSFEITADDMRFYERIHVPPPTWCPECRLVRRLIWRNERALYKRTCDLCAKSMFSMYPAASVFPVYCIDCWRSDKWDAMSHGTDYNWNKPFIMQFKELLHRVPRQSLFQLTSVNSDFCNFSRDVKNVYVSYSTVECEDVYYCKNSDRHCSWMVDCYDSTGGCQNCYEMIKGEKNYHCKFAYLSYNCMNSSFLFDCRNCTNCFMCSNLRNKEYYFRNKPYTKEEYQKAIREANLGSYNVLGECRDEYREMISHSLHKYADLLRCVSSSGNNLVDCKNSHNSFTGIGMENAKYMFRALPVKDAMDDSYVGVGLERCYESVSGGIPNSSDVMFCANGLSTLAKAYYSDFCISCSNIFFCAALKSKSHCILNKQYTKEEYKSLLPKIIDHMNAMPYVDSKGRVYRYGEFFPPDLSPFCYNETIAQEYFPLTKEQALEKGYRWKEPEERNLEISIHPQDLPDHIKDVPDDIVNQIIGCQHAGTASSAKASEAACNEQCTTGFKIIEPELQFYRKMNLPLPRLCPNCRHYQRLKQRNPLKLWHRKCACLSAEALAKVDAYRNSATHRHGATPCTEEFETSYSPERPEIVYCEGCYNAEVV